MVVEYYSVDSKAVVARSKNIVQSDDNDIDGMTTYLLKTDNDSIFSATETILAPTVSGQDANGNDTGKLLMYVLDKTDAGLKVVMVNASGNTAATINSLNAGKRLVRMDEPPQSWMFRLRNLRLYRRKQATTVKSSRLR